MSTRAERDRERYASDPDHRERIKARSREQYQRNKERRAAQVREYRRKNPHMQWAANLKRYENMTVQAWWDMLISQAGRCAICNDPMEKPCVDHDHATGRVRGLLCESCNHGLGKFFDSVDRLGSAIQYLSPPDPA